MEEYWVRAIRDGILAVVAALGAHWACCGIILCLTLMVVRGRRQERAMAEERVRERRVREELEAYTRLDPSLMEGIESGLDSASAAKALARRVCRTIAERSLFSRVSMLLRNAEGRLVCVGERGDGRPDAGGARGLGGEDGGRGAREFAAGVIGGGTEKLFDSAGHVVGVRSRGGQLGDAGQEGAEALAAGDGGSYPHPDRPHGGRDCDLRRWWECGTRGGTAGSSGR